MTRRAPEASGAGRQPSPRARLMDAMIALVVAQGYDATTIEMLTERAGVTRAEFDRHFADKEDCCLQTFHDVSERLNQHLAPIYLSSAPWRERMRAVAYAAARYFRDHEADVQFGALELFRAGDLAQARREQTLQVHVEQVDSVRYELDDPDAIPASAADLVVGSYFELLVKRLPSEGLANVESFVPELMYITVRAYLGVDAAEEELRIPPPPEPDVR